MTPYERAGAALADATHLVVAAGAGASADSGMLVFSQGRYIRKNLGYCDLPSNAQYRVHIRLLNGLG